MDVCIYGEVADSSAIIILLFADTCMEMIFIVTH
jgi:hypothetical protein